MRFAALIKSSLIIIVFYFGLVLYYSTAANKLIAKWLSSAKDTLANIWLLLKILILLFKLNNKLILLILFMIMKQLYFNLIFVFLSQSLHIIIKWHCIKQFIRLLIFNQDRLLLLILLLQLQLDTLSLLPLLL